MSSRGSITWPPPRTEMPSASRGSGAVHDALDSIDLRLDLHDLVPWSRRLCPEGRHSTGRRGGAGRRAKLSRVQHNANSGLPSTVAAFAWTEAWPAQPYGHAHDDFFSTATKPPHDPLGLDVGGTEDGSEDCSDEHIQRLRLRGCARTAECPRARSQKTVAKQGRHLEGGSN